MSAITIWTIGDERTASTRLRIHQYLPLLAAEGIHPRVRAVPHGFVPRMALFASLGRPRVLLVQKKLFSPLELRRLRGRAERLLYDVDDAVHLDEGGSTRNRDRFLAVTAAADRVLAGNATLAAACAEPSRAIALGTPVDTTRIAPAPAEGRDPFLAAWIGSRAGLPSLELVRPAWERVRARVHAARWVIMADRPPAWRAEGVEFTAWSPDAERALLARASVGLMPLLDTPFNRGKCGFKILLYQAAGIAVVASPIGVNTELVRPLEDGFLAGDASGWEEALSRLLLDRAFAARCGAAGRAQVERAHSVEALYPRFRAALLEGPAR